MGYSNHAKSQAQRRGISPELVKIIEAYGEEIKSNRQCKILRLGRREIVEVKNDFSPLWRTFRDKIGVVLVVSESGDKVTAKHQYKRLWKKLPLSTQRD